MTNPLCSPDKLPFSTTTGLDLTPTPAAFHQKNKKKQKKREKKKKGLLVSSASLAERSSPLLRSSYGEPNKLDADKCCCFFFFFFFFSLSSSFVA